MFKYAYRQKSFWLCVGAVILGIVGYKLAGAALMLCAAAVQWNEDGYL